MKVDEWLDLPTIKLLSQHASASLAALGFFGIVRFALALVPLSSVTKTTLEALDEFALVGIVVWLIYQMACLLWKGRIKHEVSSTAIMVA